MVEPDRTAIPADVVESARRVSGWMKANGYDRWQLEGCADRASVERLQRELDAQRLLMESDMEFLRSTKSRLTDILRDMAGRR